MLDTSKFLKEIEENLNNKLQDFKVIRSYLSRGHGLLTTLEFIVEYEFNGGKGKGVYIKPVTS